MRTRYKRSPFIILTIYLLLTDTLFTSPGLVGAGVFGLFGASNYPRGNYNNFGRGNNPAHNGQKLNTFELGKKQSELEKLRKEQERIKNCREMAGDKHDQAACILEKSKKARLWSNKAWLATGAGFLAFGVGGAVVTAGAAATTHYLTRARQLKMASYREREVNADIEKIEAEIYYNGKVRYNKPGLSPN